MKKLREKYREMKRWWRDMHPFRKIVTIFFAGLFALLIFYTFKYLSLWYMLLAAVVFITGALIDSNLFEAIMPTPKYPTP